VSVVYCIARQGILEVFFLTRCAV